jgi:hypothetical protein
VYRGVREHRHLQLHWERFNRCNGITSLNGSCPANSFSDYDIASLAFSAPLGANLSSANEASSPNLIAWMIGDALGDTPSFSSTDANAAAELIGISLSTDSSGAITGWAMNAETPGFNQAIGQPGDALAGINSPTFIGGSGFPLADYLIGNGGNINLGWNLGNGFTGVWTQTDGIPGGQPSAPVFLLGGSPVAGVTGTISGQGAEEYYGFFWGGGAFSATASITGASGAASYLFEEGTAGGFCSDGTSKTLSSGDSFASTIAIANLAPGQYCIGIDANSPSDPAFAITLTLRLKVRHQSRPLSCCSLPD